MDDNVRILIVGGADSVGWALPTKKKRNSWWAAPTLHTFPVESVDAAIHWLAHSPVDLIVLAAPRRGLFQAGDAQRLRASAPLCRVVVVAGPWCEGPWRRNVDQLGAEAVVPGHRWTTWLRSNAGQILRRLLATWSLPASATVDELADFWSGCRLPQGHGLVAVHSQSRDAAEAIGEVLALAGYASCWQPPGVDAMVQGVVLQGVAAQVVEANGWNEAIAAKIQSLREQSADSPLLLLLNFPLPADIQAARAAGAAAVMGKPFTLHEFLGQLEALLPRAKVPHEEAA